MVKVTSERLPNAQVVLSIEVEPEAVEKASQRAYQSLVNRINVPGFRRGKAPRHLVERMIGGPEALRKEGLERLIPEVYREAVEQTGLDPIDPPELDVVSTEPLIVKATISVQPTVELGDYKAIRVAKLPVDVPYERINETVERLRDQHTRWEPVDRPARVGDRIVADVQGLVGAVPTLYDGSGQPILSTEGRDTLFDQKDAEIEINRELRTPVPGFHNELVGIAPKSEKRFMLSLPEDWPHEAQRMLSVLFHVVVGEIKEAKVPALDDEFAKSLGDGHDSLEALREDVRQRLREQLEHEAEHQYQDAVIAEAVAGSTIELPPPLVTRETDRLVSNFRQNLARQRLTIDQYLKMTSKSAEDMREELRPTAEKNLRGFLVLREIAKAEGIEVAESEVDLELERIVGALGEGDDVQRVRQYLARPEEREEIKSTIWHRTVVAHLTEIAQQPAEVADEAPPKQKPSPEKADSADQAPVNDESSKVLPDGKVPADDESKTAKSRAKSGHKDSPKE